MAKEWRRCKSNMFRRVDFALGSAMVRLLSSFVYQRSVESPGGRVYHVEDVTTGRRDFVGVEYLTRVEEVDG